MVRWMTLASCLFLVTSTQAIVPLPVKSSAFLKELEVHFKAWDTNSDGKISKEELDHVIADAKVKDTQAAAAAALKRSTRSKKVEMPELTMETVSKIVMEKRTKKTTMPDLESYYAQSLERIRTAAKKELFPEGLPKLEALHQGKTGDCFCLAPLGAMLHRDPKEVTKLFETHAEGSCKVRFGTMTIDVPQPTDGEIALTASTEKTGIWVNTYEKAVGIYRVTIEKPDDKNLAVESINRGGSAGTMLSVLTGHEITRLSCDLWKSDKATDEQKKERLKQMRERMQETMKAHRLMCGGTGTTTTLPPGMTPNLPAGMTPNHAYALLAYHADKDEVEVWNPHGQTFKPKGTPGLTNGYPTEDGKFRVPLTELVTFFAGFSFETDQPRVEKKK